jgi:predicted SnoaL-like aldol condensation-catalyzing enzyme
MFCRRLSVTLDEWTEFRKGEEVNDCLEGFNTKRSMEAFDLLFNARDYRVAQTYWSPGLLEHSSHLGPGRDGLFDFVRCLPDSLKYENERVVAENDFVMLYGRYSGNGTPRNWIVAEMVRLKDGILVEHWSIVQDEPTRAESRSGLPAFGNAFPA